MKIPTQNWNGISNYFLVFEIFAIDSKTVSFIFEHNSLELVLSKLISVLEWNAASLALTSPLFRSTFSIIHVKISLTLVCRVLIVRLIIGYLEGSRMILGRIHLRFLFDTVSQRFSKHILTVLVGTKYHSFRTIF